MRKNIMVLFKEFNPACNNSMRDYFQESPSPYIAQILSYLNNGEVALASTSHGIDVFTGEHIVDTCYIMTDGEYSWPNTLGYYVVKYNLALPDEFMKKILSKQMLVTNSLNEYVRE